VLPLTLVAFLVHEGKTSSRYCISSFWLVSVDMAASFLACQVNARSNVKLEVRA